MLTVSRSYASHNNYIGFKRTVHDALHPEDEAPPMPHASTWFPTSPTSAPNTATRTRVRAKARRLTEEQELAIAREKISIRCPLTLLPFRDPVTSSKCPHSFEKEAILDMIEQSDARIGGTGRRGDKGVKAVQCPVCEMVCRSQPEWTLHSSRKNFSRSY